MNKFASGGRVTSNFGAISLIPIDEDINNAKGKVTAKDVERYLSRRNPRVLKAAADRSNTRIKKGDVDYKQALSSIISSYNEFAQNVADSYEKQIKEFEQKLSGV